MSEKEINLGIEKMYFSIGEVANMLNVNTSLIRFWEKEFDIIQPKKNTKGNRLFTRKDIDNLQTIYCLVKERGFTLPGAKEKLKTERFGDVEKNIEIVKTLKELKSFLEALKSQL